MKGKTRFILALAATLVLSGAAIGGVVFAQTNSPTPSPSKPSTAPTATAGQQTNPSSGSAAQGNAKAAARNSMTDDFLNQLAQNLGVSRTTLDNALKTTAGQQIDKAVANGTLTQAQGTAAKQRLANGQFPIGFGGFGGIQHRAPGKGGAAINLKQALAGALGVSTTELQQDLKNGQTIAQIAQAHGKTVQDVQNAVVASIKSSLDKAVQAGTLTQTQENNMLQRIQSGIQQGKVAVGGRPPRGNASRATPTPAASQ